MKRYIFTLIGILCMAFCFAQTISRETAQTVAQNYWNIIYADKKQNLGRNTVSSVSILSPENKAPMYAVQMEEGWVLVASEKAVEPVLAASPTGEFPDYEDMPDGMKWLMSYYETANQYARDSIGDSRQVNAKWDELLNNTYTFDHSDGDRSYPSSYVLSRMALVKWGQSVNNDNGCTPSYNALCPPTYIVSCYRTLVGCGAVAMGMIMWYWQWPYSAIIPRQYDISGYFNTPYLATYDWNHLPSELHNSTNSNEAYLLAHFLRDCGYAVSMEYENDGSSSNLVNTRTALMNVFHYKSTIYHYYKNLNVDSYWNNMLKQEIYDGRPIIYRGSTADDEGHAFVLFGYNADNKYRVNWGWNGSHIESEYALNVLGPTDTLFNYSQSALFGVEPNSPTCSNDTYFYQTNVNNNIFEIHKSGTLHSYNAGNGVTIQSTKTGCIYASQAVHLRAPFSIKQGAYVHIAVRDALCDERSIIKDETSLDSDEESEPSNINKSQVIQKSKTEFSVYPNPAIDYIKIQSNKELTNISIINSNGVVVMRSANLHIPVLFFVPGLYVIRAESIDGELLQTKFLKQ